jgi:GAF domain-containing protein/FixJ family two-component response regulator
MTRVLIVDQGQSIGNACLALLEEEGCQLHTVGNILEVDQSLLAHPCDVVIANIVQPELGGAELIQRVRQIDEDLPVIIIAGRAHLSNGLIDALSGAYDAVVGPITPQRLLYSVARAAERKRLLDENRRLKAENTACRADLEREVEIRTAELEQRSQELETLIEIVRDICPTLNLNEVLKQMTQLSARVCAAHRCTIVLLTEDGEMVIPAMSQFGHGREDRTMWDLFQDKSYPVPVDQIPEARHVISEKQPLFIPDVRASSLPEHLTKPFGIRSVLLVPLVSRERVIGLMALDHVEPGHVFTAAQMDLAMSIAAQAAMAIENARLYQETQRRVAELEAVRQAGLHATSTLELHSVLEAILESALQLVSGSDAHVFLYDGQKLSFGAAMWAAERQAEPYAEPRPNGLSYSVARSGQRIVIPDVRSQPLFRDDARAEWTGAIVGLPLKVGDRIQGVMNVAFDKQRKFGSDELGVLELLATQAAIAVENARLFKEAHRHVEELTALHNIDMVITSTLSLDEVLQRVYEQIGKVIDASTFYIALYDEEKAELHFRLIVDQGEQLAPFTLDVRPDSGFAGWVVHSRKPLWIDDWERDRHSLPVEGITRGAPTRSLMVLPLITKGELVGVMSSQSQEPHAFDEGHRRLFADIANQVAIAIENARLFGEVNRHLNQTRLLQRVMEGASSTLDFDQVLRRTIGALHETLEIDYLSFSLPDKDGTCLRLHPSQIGYSSTMTAVDIPLDGSVSGRVYRTGKSAVISDARQSPDYFEAAPEVQSELSVPVKVAGRVIAVLGAESPQIDAFDQEDLRLFQAVAAQLGVVLENTRLFEQIKRRLAEVEAVQEVTLAAVSTLDFDQVLERSVGALHRTTDIDSLGFLLPDEEGKSLIPHPPLAGSQDDALHIPIENTLAGQAYRTGQLVLVHDVTEGTTRSKQSVKVRSALNVPVQIGNRVAAVLRAESPRAGAFGDDEVRLFTTIAGQLGVVLENARLYRRLQEQRDELSQAYEEVMEMERLRSELVQNVGHELRTPFSLVQGYTELLLTGDLGPLLQEQREALRIVRDRLGTLRHLIRNLTTLDRVSRSRPEFQTTSVVDVTECALEQLLPSAEKAGIRLQAELSDSVPPVLGNRDLLVLAFTHLLDNAIKFSPRGSTVTVRAWCNGTQTYVSFNDEGIGIAPQHLDRIFERFYQADGGLNRRFGGMGIGLALVWEIIEAHGGCVEVESAPSEGSTFTITLPRAGLEELPSGETAIWV